MSALAQADVDLAAVAANVRTIAAVAGTDLMAVAKADGFGHGAIPVTRAAQAAGASWLGVTSTAEALALRSAGITALVLSRLHSSDAEPERFDRTRGESSRAATYLPSLSDQEMRKVSVRDHESLRGARRLEELVEVEHPFLAFRFGTSNDHRRAALVATQPAVDH